MNNDGVTRRWLTTGDEKLRRLTGGRVLTWLLATCVSPRGCARVLALGVVGLFFGNGRSTMALVTVVVAWLTLGACLAVVNAGQRARRLRAVVDELQGDGSSSARSVEQVRVDSVFGLTGASLALVVSSRVLADGVDSGAAWLLLSVVAVSSVFALAVVVTLAVEHVFAQLKLVESEEFAVTWGDAVHGFLGITACSPTVTSVLVNATWLAVVYLLTNASVAG